MICNIINSTSKICICLPRHQHNPTHNENCGEERDDLCATGFHGWLLERGTEAGAASTACTAAAFGDESIRLVEDARYRSAVCVGSTINTIDCNIDNAGVPIIFNL